MAKPKAKTKTASKPVDQSNSPYYGDFVNGQLVVKDRKTGQIIPGAKITVSGGVSTVTDANGQPLQMTGAGGRIYTPPSSLSDLPAGSYDPSIDYSSGAANRGVGYAQQDYGTQYATPDGTTLADLLKGRAPADINATNPDGSYKYGRAVRDYFTQQGRVNQDYTTATGDLNTSYQRLGQTQLQGINAAGDLEGGALAQSLSKRTANQAHDQSGLDTQHTRSLADLLSGVSNNATDAYTTLQRTVGENAPYQASLLATAGQESAPSLAGNPNYETHNGTIYQRLPAGGVAPVVSKPKKQKYPHPIGKSYL